MSGSNNSTVCFSEAMNNEWQSTELRGHENTVNSVAISADGAHFATGSDDETLRAWEEINEEWYNRGVMAVEVGIAVWEVSGRVG